jgi:hypothetical protein
MKKVTISILIITSCVLFGCSRLGEIEKPYVGEWKFFSKEDDFPEPMLSYVETNNVHLEEDGSWTLGNSHGKWGGDGDDLTWGWWKQEYKNLDLKFTDYEVEISNHANQFDAVNGAICIVDGIEVLRVSVNYTYDRNNFYQNRYGEIDSYSSQSIASVTYLFVRKEASVEEVARLDKHFKDIVRKQYGNMLSDTQKISNPISWIDEYIGRNPTDFEKAVLGLEYNIEAGASSFNQQTLLSWIYLTKSDTKKATDLILAIQPQSRLDSIEINTLLLSKDFIEGKINDVKSFDRVFNPVAFERFTDYLSARDRSFLERATIYNSIKDSIPINLKNPGYY